MAKAKKSVTAKRQVFLDALEIIKKRDRLGGIDVFKTSEELSKLLGNAPRSGWLAEEWAICSALWASEIPAELPEVGHIHEHCKGGELFFVAYHLGVLSERRKASKRE